MMYDVGFLIADLGAEFNPVIGHRSSVVGHPSSVVGHPSSVEKGRTQLP
jgi:hypothetical protein